MQNETIHTEFSSQTEASLESLPPRMAAAYDDKRFPTKWQAMIGAASMQILGVIASMLLGMLLLIGAFRTQFGYTMFNYVCSQLIMVVSIPLFMLMVCRKDLRTTVRLKKGIDAVQIGLLLLVSMGAFFLCQHLNGIFVQILSIFMGEPADLGMSEGATDLTQLLFQIVIVAGLPAICEELFFRGFVLSFCGFRRNIASGVDFRLFLGSVGARLHLLINFFQLIQRVFALFSQFVGVFFHPGDIFVVPFFQLFAEFVHRFRQLAGIVVIIFLGGFGAVIFQFLYRFSGQFQHFVSEDADCFTYRHTC